jgi:outer membrane protein assembly factor BamD (BamD/ComL family)
MLGGVVACEDPQQTQTQAFEYAEAHYRAGDYDAALDGYQAFLEAYPQSPLAETAELRIRCIHREVRSVLMRKDMPRPRYVGAANQKQASNGAQKSSTNPTTQPNNRLNNNENKQDTD